MDEKQLDPIQFADIENEFSTYIKKPNNVQFIRDAYAYAEEKHRGQFRKSGDPYIVHCLHVGLILAKMHTGPSTIAAGLLHDTIEDCNVDIDDFKERFGEEVYSLVDAVTKIGALKFTDEKEYLAANHRKIFIAMAKDVRVIIIKLVDRLHNMRTLQYMSPEKQKKIASETLEVYAPIAHRLGISEIKNELEDLSFHYLNPDKYYEIAHLVELRKSERDAQINEMILEISEMLDAYHIQYRIFGRSKHLYSIYKKMQTKNKRFDEILDLLAIRIVTDTKEACYEILGYIHAKYRPIPGRFKDYIAMPKANMYQSLHTTIVADGGHIFEVQIRTEEMDSIAERGIAAHWIYKENSYNKQTEQKEIEEQLEWFREFSLMYDETENDDVEFMNTVSKDIFNANIYVLSPKGKVINLPNGSTPIDFAYRIHTEVGHQTIGASVNGVLVPLNTPLKTGDVVSIKTNKNSHPSEDWLKFVKSNHAKNKIRNYFQKIEQKAKEEGIARGKDLLEDELIKRGYDYKTFMEHKRLSMCASACNLHNENELFYAIYCKSLTLPIVIERLTHQKIGSTSYDNQEVMNMLVQRDEKKRRQPSKYGIRVSGIDNMKVTLATCCSPIPGDDIVGYVTKGQGVKVHRAQCPNVIKDMSRTIDVEWDEDFEPELNNEATIIIYSNDRNYLLSDIVTVSSQCKVSLQHVDSKVNEDGLSATTKLKVLVRDLDQLNLLMTNLRKVMSVNSVERVIL